jgi:transcriptional regulator GlxA family with amidase domain
VFGFLIYPDLEELDLAGPWEMITLWNAHAAGPACRTIGPSDQPVRCRKGLQLLPDATVDDAPDLQYLLVPGGKGSKAAAQDPRVVDFVRDRAESVDLLVSVCTGVRVLRAAGLLDGRRITTHWAALDEARQWPEVDVVEERHVRDGTIWTAAGVSAGIDLALALIAAEGGEEAAVTVQRRAEYFPSARRYGDTAEWAEAPGYLRSCSDAER